MLPFVELQSLLSSHNGKYWSIFYLKSQFYPNFLKDTCKALLLYVDFLHCVWTPWGKFVLSFFFLFFLIYCHYPKKAFVSINVNLIQSLSNYILK